MKHVIKNIVAIMLMLAIVGSNIEVIHTTVYAANGTIKIYIGDSKTVRHHKAIGLGERTEEISFKLNDGTVKTSNYESSNPTSFKIVNTGEGKCIVEALKEGTGLVILTVKTKEGETYTEKLFISVFAKIGNYKGLVNKDTDVYRGATDNANVENRDIKGNLKQNTKISVIASCNNFYLIYEDNLDTGFVKKSDINILADTLKINEDNISVTLNNNAQLTTTIYPRITTNKGVNWKSSNKKIATIDSSGKVVGKSEGTAIITASTKDGSNKTDSVYISIYNSLVNTLGFLNIDSKLYKVANNKFEKGVGKKGDIFTIVGECENYYLVKNQDSSVYIDDNSNQYCYVLKSNVTIPVKSIMFDDDVVNISVNELVNLKATVYPTIASNKRIKYISDNSLVARVNSTGLVKAYKEGIAHITAITEDGQYKDSCAVNVSGIEKVSWVNNKANKKTKDKFNVKGKDDKSIIATWGNYKSVKRFELQRANKNSNKYKSIKKLNKKSKQYIDKNVKFYTFYKYRLLIVKTNGKKFYSKIKKARTKDCKVNINLTASGYTISSIKLKWNRQKHVKKYEILRAKNKNGKYKKIKTVSSSKKTYIDKKVKYYKKYYYKVNIIRTNNIDKCSKKVEARTKYKLNKEKNLKFFRTYYPFICTDTSKNINDYYVYDKYYAPVKYQFDGKTLKIHIYIDFVKYIGSKENGYKKTSASRTDGKGGVAYVKLYKQGVKDNFNVDIAENKYEFKNVNFSVRVIFHEKGKERYNSNQYFNEILIGGECPNCTSKGDHWYHQQGFMQWSAEKQDWVSYFSRIYLPYDYQVKSNTAPGYQETFGKKEYLYTVAHETGHLLGLYDAYSTTQLNKNTGKYQLYDRFTDNLETGVKCIYEENKNIYDNLMVEQEWDKRIIANDLEMMLYAYQQTQGRPTDAYQSYKTVQDLNMVISSCIANKKDLYEEDKQ